MDSFSWFMTLVTSALDVTLQLSVMKQVMQLFIKALFEEQIGDMDYLQRKLPQHIQGWISAAVVRNISKKARIQWNSLLQAGVRLPGDIPRGEVGAVACFLVWIAGAEGSQHSKRFDTTSSDIYSPCHRSAID